MSTPSGIENYTGRRYFNYRISGGLGIYLNGKPVELKFSLADNAAINTADFQSIIDFCNPHLSIFVNAKDFGISRTPVFMFNTMTEAQAFQYSAEHFLQHKAAEVLQGISRHTKLIDYRFRLIGSMLMLSLCFSTGLAAGQNMASIAADALAKALVENSDVKPENQFLESNLTGDKKGTALALAQARGVEVSIQLLAKETHCPPLQVFENNWHKKVVLALESNQSGYQLSSTAVLESLMMATGQDIATLPEIQNLVLNTYAIQGKMSVNMLCSGIIAGTIGGGTGSAEVKSILAESGISTAVNPKLTLAALMALVMLLEEVFMQPKT